MRRTAIFATAAAVLVCAWLGVSHFNTETSGAGAFAQTLSQIDKAKTITWKVMFYEHVTSKDGKRTWLHTEVMECAYRAPGLRREVRLDEQGQVTSVEITDFVHGRRLTYSPTEKKATLSEVATFDYPGPFAPYRERLDAPNLQWIENRKTATGEVNVFRNAYRDHDNERDWSIDFWIDTKTKQLVGVRQPGADIYDPEKDPARNNPPEKDWSELRMMGGGPQDIRYDVTLEDSLFRLEPPEGYAVEVKQRDRVTEKEMIDYLGILAEFNDQMFPDQLIPSPSSLNAKYNRVLKKPSKDQTSAERKLLDTDVRYSWRFGTVTNAPILVFLAWDPDSTVQKSFRYLGKGVKLGDKDRIVCWYKLKNAENPNVYRVIYGDLSVKDVAPEALPLPVQP
jgi:outer membrane lipoprotein-sorting protein